MNLRSFGRVGRLAAIGAILLFSASCIKVNEQLGQNLIPTDQKWDVFPQEAQPLKDIRLQMADSLSGYSSTRFTFGAVTDDLMGTTIKSTSFTLVPVQDSLDFGTNTEITGFHFTAARDTLSTVFDNQQRVIQNVYVYELKEALDSTVLYSGAFDKDKYVNTASVITEGIPVYDGGDSLSFEFSKEFAESIMERLKKADMDSLALYVEDIPGIYITTDTPAGEGGRINMFDLPLEFDDFGYMSGNYAELKITADYEDRKQVDTSFIFIFGPSSLIAEDASTSEIPTQYAFNASEHATTSLYDEAVKAGEEGLSAAEKIIVEGGSGLKPVILAKEIKEKLHKMIDDAKITNSKEVVINKATITLPYNVNADWSKLDKYPVILSPTVRLRSSGDTKYVSYAGLTDSSIESENQGNINRSLSQYAPDISHHVQEILKLEKKADETAAEFEERLASYDIWMLIMSEEVTSSSSSSSASSDYYNNLLYNSYYNNMMYDPYGYGYGYGGYGGYYGGYGYGGYGGYGGYDYSSNYYNYMMMAMYANASTSTGSSDSVSIELDKDRYFDATLNGTQSSADIKALPRLSVTFAAPKTAEAK